MPSLSPISVILLVWITSICSLASPVSSPVCIVGAGPAGLTAAARLESKGKKVIIFEKQPLVGGKCQAYYEKGFYHPLGALLFSNLTYTETLPIVNKVGVPSVPFQPLGSVTSYHFNITTGAVTKQPSPDAKFVVELGAEVLKYSTYWTINFFPLYQHVGYRYGVPEKYTVSCEEWLDSHGYKQLKVLFIGAMVAYGYGDLRQVPILYMLQYLTPDIVLFFAGLHPGYLVDFHEVFTRYSKTLKSQIITSSQISKIDRSSGYPEITFTSPYHLAAQTQQCSALIMAFPPTLTALAAANLDVTEAETDLFSTIGITNYYSAAVRVKMPFGTAFSADSGNAHLPPLAEGQPVTFLRLWNGSDIATSWSWDMYRDVAPLTAEQAKDVLKQTISKFNRDPAKPSEPITPVTDDDIKAFVKTEYFPHWDGPQLKAGAYKTFAKLQGQKRTYWASGLNGFETVEWAVRAGKDVVDRFVLKNIDSSASTTIKASATSAAKSTSTTSSNIAASSTASSITSTSVPLATPTGASSALTPLTNRWIFSAMAVFWLVSLA